MQYWLSKNTTRDQCWIVIARIGEIINHKDCTITENGKAVSSLSTLSQETLEYVFFAEIIKRADSQKLVTYVCDTSGKYYLIKNVMSADGIVSNIFICDKFQDGLKLLTGEERKQLGIKKTPVLNEKQKTALKGTVCVDFICKAVDEKITLWAQFTNAANDTLDLSGFQNIDPVIVDSTPVNTNIKTLVLYQNPKIVDFKWASRAFPNIKSLSVWVSNTLDNQSIKNIVIDLPNLVEFEAHQCYALTGRCLIDLLSLPKLHKLAIANPTFICQENAYATVITTEEWKNIHNDQLTILLIDTDNITADFACYLCEACPNLDRLIVSDHAIKRLYESTASGFDREELIFQSAQNLKKGFKRNKTVKFMNLVRNKANSQPFSDSMRKIIDEKNTNSTNLKK